MELDNANSQAGVAVPLPARSAQTPMMQQYWRIKHEAPEGFLFFRMGDFFELFHDDAVRAASLLNITLTSRDKQSPDPVPMCGVPVHSYESYVARLTERGHQVVICDQVEDPRQAKGIVRREIVRIITPSTTLSDSAYEDGQSSYLASVHQREQVFGAVFIDIGTGSSVVHEADSALTLLNIFHSYDVREILVADHENLSPRQEDVQQELRDLQESKGLVMRTLASEHFHNNGQLLCERLGIRSLKAFEIDADSPLIGALNAALFYLQRTQCRSWNMLKRIEFPGQRSFLVLDQTTQTHLAIFEEPGGTKAHTLFGFLDRTCTKMGQRCLRQWLAQPLASRPAILERQDAVAEIGGRYEHFAVLMQPMKQMSDLSRTLATVDLGRTAASHLVRLRSSLEVLHQTADQLEHVGAELLQSIRLRLGNHRDLEGALFKALADDIEGEVGSGLVIREGYDRQLDEARKTRKNGRDRLGELERAERERTGIGNLRVRYNRVFGYFFEVSKGQLSKVPADYQRKQTLTNAERFVNEQLQSLQAQLQDAEARIAAREKELFDDLVASVLVHIHPLQMASDALAEFDVLRAFARVSTEHDCVRPDIVDEAVLHVEEARHPVVERHLKKMAFVPNEIRLDPDSENLAIITGPNMAGKSTYLRQTGLIVLMAHIGCDVPARSARIGLCDRLFTRMGAADDISRGRSTFMVEMEESARILQQATDRSVVILDEVGRGTSTYDGLSLARAIAEDIHDRIRCRALFATHYHEMTDMVESCQRAKNLNAAVVQRGDAVIFLYTMMKGGANKSHGIGVARLAGMPPTVIERAREILAQLEADHHHMTIRDGDEAQGQIGLFQSVDDGAIVRALREAQPDAMTPLEALQLLIALKAELDQGGLK